MKPYDLGFICGRFQTFHKGHASLIESGLKLCDRILVLIGSAQESGTTRNPYNVATRLAMIKEVFPQDNVMVYALSDLTNEFDITHEWGDYLMNKIHDIAFKNPDIMIYGNDEARGTLWFRPETLADTAQFIANRQVIPISATQLRTLMLNDRRQEWMQWVSPKLHKHYDRLRAELTQIQEE